MSDHGRSRPRPEGGGPGEVIELLVRRETFLERLADSVATKAELVDALDVSRSTVDRALRDLRTEGVVDRTSEGYRLTPYGDLAFVLFRSFSGDLRNVREVGSPLGRLASTEGIHPEFFRGGRVLSARTPESAEPAAELRELVAGADELWTVTPSPHFELLSLAHRRVVEEDLAFRLVHSAETLERLAVHHPAVVESALESGSLELYRAPEVPPVGLLKSVAGDGQTVVLALYGPRGETTALVLADTEAAVARFDRLFRRYLEASTRVTAEDVDGGN